MARFNLEDYDTVETRLVKFWGDHPQGRIHTEIFHYDEKHVVIKAIVFFDVDEYSKATGFAEEVRGAGPVNQTSHLENCETSAIGRALANCGYAGNNRPSREEMEKVARGPVDTDPLVSPESVTKFVLACENAGIAFGKVLSDAGIESLDGLRESGRLRLLDAFKVRKSLMNVNTADTTVSFPRVADNIIPLVQPEKPVVAPSHPSTGFVPASDKQIWALGKMLATQGLTAGEQLELAIARTGRLISKLADLSKGEASKLISDSKQVPVKDSDDEESF